MKSVLDSTLKYGAKVLEYDFIKYSLNTLSKIFKII